MGKQLEPVDQLFAGLKTNLMPLGIIANVTMNTNSSQWVTETAASWKKALDDAKLASQSTQPVASKMYNNIGISIEGTQLSAELTVDEALLDNVGAAFEQAIAPLFSFGSSSPSQGKSKPVERLEDNPTPFYAQYDAGQLQTFDSTLNPQFKASCCSE